MQEYKGEVKKVALFEENKKFNLNLKVNTNINNSEVKNIKPVISARLNGSTQNKGESRKIGM